MTKWLTTLRRKPPFPSIFLLLTLALVLFLPLEKISAHIVAEEPWHPVSAAYLRSIFYINLGPNLDWDLIASEYDAPVEESGYHSMTPYELLEEAGVDTDPIRQAIDSQDRQALYTASTRALSQYTRHFISESESNLSMPGAAVPDVLTAQQIYRAFGESFISTADPVAFERLGQAWLDMASSAGSAGALGIGGTPPEPERFAVAKQTVESYLAANYEAETFAEHEVLVPIPENSPTADAAMPLPIWLPPGSNLNNQDPLPLLRLNFEARGFDETDIPLVAYGDMLFDSPAILGDPARSIGLACSSCHNRSDINNSFFIPGVSHQAGAADVDGAFFNSFFNDQRPDSLDIPSLRGVRFTAPYGRDGRFESLREFTRNVIVNEFGGPEPTEFMLDALVAYMLEFDFQPNSYLSPDGTLNEDASEAARRGEVIFNTPYESMGGRACSTCHVPSSNFIDGLTHDIGSGDPSAPFARDAFFDTPTLVNSNYTAPYFHDGSLEALADVVEWFDQQYQLGLSSEEETDLTAYLVEVGSADEPFEVFDEENTPFALDWAELTTFSSTLGSMLIPRQDAYHAILLIDSVAPDMRVDASGLQDLSQAPLVYEIADKLDEIKAAIEAHDWERAAALYEEYESLVAEYTPILK